LGASAPVVDALSRRGITTPFPVQVATIGDALAGHDLCVQAPTGSGKTIAFGIPLVERVTRSQAKRPHALVLAPTRELAAQIAQELTLLSNRKLRVATVYGGVGYGAQLKALRSGVDILVACPGRLEDLIERKEVRLEQVDTVVIDEADRMADMGFLPSVRRILDQTASPRQTLLFSATLDGEIAKLTAHYQRDPITHTTPEDEANAADLEHRFDDVSGDVVAHTAELIRAAGPTIVFCRTRHRADRVAKQLRASGIEASAIHGGLSQNKRDETLARFKSSKIRALVATDVAARGIHVDAVACVVHFDLPADKNTYVHRSGRTGRAGARGTVVTLVTNETRAAARALERQVTGQPPERTGGKPRPARSGHKRPAHAHRRRTRT
jgi:superfamily II DNA/RNA helicase